MDTSFFCLLVALGATKAKNRSKLNFLRSKEFIVKLRLTPVYPTAIILAKKNDQVVAIPPKR
jgi:hypothetical protein